MSTYVMLLCDIGSSAIGVPSMVAAKNRIADYEF